MNTTRNTAPPATRTTTPTAAPRITTEELAHRLRNRAQTARAGYCRDGHYLGLVPTKLPSGRLLWDATAVDALLSGLPANAPDEADIAAHQSRKASNPAKLPKHIALKVAAKAKRMAAAEVDALPTGEVAA